MKQNRIWENRVVDFVSAKNGVWVVNVNFDNTYLVVKVAYFWIEVVLNLNIGTSVKRNFKVSLNTSEIANNFIVKTVVKKVLGIENGLVFVIENEVYFINLKIEKHFTVEMIKNLFLVRVHVFKVGNLNHSMIDLSWVVNRENREDRVVLSVEDRAINLYV